MQYKTDAEARRTCIELPEGVLTLQVGCPTWLIETLKTDQGFSAFARRPEREHQRLMNLAREPETSLSLAYTPEGVIVGQVTLAPVDQNGWWSGLANAYEIAIEVSSAWRGKDIAHRLLDFTLADESIEDLIILGSCFSWHWDTKNLGLSHYRYRDMLIQFLARHGFMDYITTEPNIRMEPHNVLLARIGMHVPLEVTLQFYRDLVK